MSTPPRPTSTVLLFGGTFDPPHRAHIQLPLAAASAIGAEEVRFIPAKINPQKSTTPPTSVEHRVAMLEAALEGTPHARISRIEVDHPGPSYTVDTLRRMVREPDCQGVTLRLLIGADQALNFRTWKEWQSVEEIAEPVVMPRPPHTRTTLETEYERLHPGQSARWMARTLELPMLEDCSTDIRTMIDRGDPLDSVLFPKVERYVHEHQLYGWNDPPARINS